MAKTGYLVSIISAVDTPEINQIYTSMMIIHTPFTL